jgi:predicted deacetylase
MSPETPPRPLERLAYPDSVLQQLCDVLRPHGAQVTFFVTARLFAEQPETFLRIEAEGHEVAYHTHSHARITSAAVLKEKLAKSAEFLEAFRPRGFRAPWMYLPPGLLPLLREAGFAYDSSTTGPPGTVFHSDGVQVFPVSSRPHWGRGAAAPRYPVTTSLRSLLREVPFGIGTMVSYLRGVYCRILKHYAARGLSCVFYVHTWQLATPPGERWSLRRHGLLWVSRFSLLPLIERLARRHPLRRLDSRLTAPRSDAATPVPHYLTIDVE